MFVEAQNAEFLHVLHLIFNSPTAPLIEALLVKHKEITIAQKGT